MNKCLIVWSYKVITVVGHDPVVTATVEEDTATIFNFGNHLPVYTVS